MSLVEYSSSSDETSDNSVKEESFMLSISGTKRQKLSSKVSEAEANTSKGKCARLPLPAEVVCMFNENGSGSDTHIDDPSLHGGRVRSFAHERGNWSSLVYIPFVSDWIDELTESVIGSLESVAIFHPIDELHVSVSKTFVLRHHCIEPLVTDLRQELALCHSGAIHLSDAEFYCNEEQSRTFIGLKVNSHGNLLESFVDTVDGCLCQYSLPVYYKNPSFHVSLAWSLGDVRSSYNASTMTNLQALVHKFLKDHGESSCIIVKELILKTGKKTFSLPLG